MFGGSYLETRRVQILAEMEERMNKLFEEMSGVDKETLKRLRDLMSDYYNARTNLTLLYEGHKKVADEAVEKFNGDVNKTSKEKLETYIAELTRLTNEHITNVNNVVYDVDVATKVANLVDEEVADHIENIVQTAGANTGSVMSQNATTECLRNRYAIPSNVRCVGHSIWWYDGKLFADGYRGSCYAIGYQSLLKQRYKFKSLVNYCYSGCSLGGTTANDTNSIMNHASEWSGEYGDLWILDTITNDFKRNIPIGDFWENYAANTGVTTYYGALKLFESKIRELCGSGLIAKKVIVANACRRNNDGYTSTSVNAVGHTLLDYERALLNVASWNDWLFVDQYRSALTDEAVEYATIDGLHLNNFGYNLAIRPWYECIDTLVDKNHEPLDVATFQSKYIGTNGVISESITSSWWVTDYVPVSLGEKFHVKCNTSANTTLHSVYGYDNNKKPVKSIIDSKDLTNGITFSITDNIAYIVVCSYGFAPEIYSA